MLHMNVPLVSSRKKSPAALNATPGGPRNTPPQPEDVSVAPITDSPWWSALYHAAPFGCDLSSNRTSISARNLPATLAVVYTLPIPVRWNWPICLCECRVYKVAAGTATVMLAHFPANFSNVAKIVRLFSKAARMIASSFASLSSGTSNWHRTQVHTIPRYTAVDA